MAGDYSNRQALLWMRNAVPGFVYAYTHDAQFKTIIDTQLRLMQLQVELMVVGSQTRQAQLAAEVRKAERSPSLLLTREDLERARDAGPRFIP